MSSTISPVHRSEHMELSLLKLLPAVATDAPIEAKLVHVLLDELPDFTSLNDEDIQDELDREGSMILDGSKTSTPHTTESALRQLRTHSPRYILSERFQKGAKEIAWLQFELKKPAVDVAFWRPVWNCDGLAEDYDVMDLFIIMPNRYLDTAKYFTTLDTTLESNEIRLLVLPPSSGETANPLQCQFRNVRLEDPSRPPYQTFVVSGPQNPSNGHDPVYKYDVTIGGYLCVSSNGMRTGLQQMQDSNEETLIWNRELCFNCRDEVDAKHFERLEPAILRGAKSGGILMYDRLSSTTPIMNRNRNFRLPAVNRKAREIRLLQFLGTNSVDDIKCKLVVKNLDDLPVYKALSYIWGDDTGYAMHYTNYLPDDDMDQWPLVQNATSKTKFLESYDKLAETITVNKIPLLTTKHLATALRCLRDKGECKYFWVDALCIDQTDWEDRSSQVCMMGDIYACAQQVIAWLGSGNKEDGTIDVLNMLGSDSFDIVEFINWAYVRQNEEDGEESLLTRMGNNPNQTPPSNQDLPPRKMSVPGKPLEYNADDSIFRTIYASVKDRVFIQSMEDFVSHKWWHRLWVYQESVIPESLVLHRGQYSITFEMLWNAQECIRRLSSIDPFYPYVRQPMFLNPLTRDPWKYGMLADIRQERQRRHNPGFFPPLSNDWLFYLEALARRGASNPRDVIYAALGLTTSAPQKIIPDYSKTIMEVYIDAAKATIKETDELVILSMCGGVAEVAAVWADHLMSKDQQLKRKAAPLPSWVPYWGEQNREGMGAKAMKGYRLEAPIFCAGGSGGAGAKFSKDGKILFVKGVVLDVVSKVVKGYDFVQKSGKQVTYDGTNFIFSKVPPSTDVNTPAWFKAYDAWESAIADVRPNGSEYIAGGLKVHAFTHALYAPFWKSYVTGYDGDDLGWQDALPELRARHGKVELEQERAKETPGSLGETEFVAKNSTEPYFAEKELEHELTHLVGALTISKRYELVITEKGYICVSPPGCSQVGGVQEGDVIVVLRGGGVPYILRQVGSHDRYLLIGDAYVHGMMYGAAMEGIKELDMRKFPII